MDDLIKYSEIFICNVQFILDNEACIGLITRNPRFYKLKNSNTFYDLLRNKYVTITPENYLNFCLWFKPEKTFFDILNGNYTQADMQPHLDNHVKLVDEYNKKIKTNITEKINEWSKEEVNGLYEICIEELFFKPFWTGKQDMINEMKDRLSFLSLTVDHGIISKLLAIFEIPEDKLLSKDVQVVEQCKSKWKGVIEFYVDKASRVLDRELASGFNEDLQIEVTEIKKLLTEIASEIDAKVFETPKDVASYWPELLKPTPRYVFQKPI